MKKPLMKKPRGAWKWGELGASHGLWRHACADVLGLGLVRGRARVRVAAQQHAFFGFRRSKMARATTSTMLAAAAAVVVTNLARGGEGGGRATLYMKKPFAWV